MASFKEFFDFSRKTNANTKKAGLYAIEPEPFKTPLVKVGYSRNLLARMSSYRNIYPDGVKIHMIGRVPARDQVHPSVNRDDVVAAEKKMLDMLKDPYLKRKEWFSVDKLEEIKKALQEAQQKFANSRLKRRIYTGDEIKKIADGSKVVEEVPEYEDKVKSTLTPLAEPPKKKLRTGLRGLNADELVRGAKRITEKEEQDMNKRRRVTGKKKEVQQQTLDMYAERKHRSGEYYKGTEEPPKRRRIKGKQAGGVLVDEKVEPVSRLKSKTKGKVGV